MNNHEVEVKVLEIDAEKVIAKLQSLGAIEVFHGRVLNDFFKNTAGLKLRLRRMNNKNILTYKIIHPSETVIDNEEIEVTFDNYDGLKQILLASGFEHYASSQKSRISYVYQNIHFDIDTIPHIPTFLEVEGNNTEDVKRGVELLGYTMDQTSTFTERTLKEHYGIA